MNGDDGVLAREWRDEVVEKLHELKAELAGGLCGSEGDCGDGSTVDRACRSWERVRW
jgi:hypothetical protein